MTMIDYSCEPHSDIVFIDMKSFYASVECIERNLDPLQTSLCVMSSADNAKGLILASSPTFKKIFGKSNVGRSYDLPFDPVTRRFNYYRAKKQGLPMDEESVRYIEYWARRTLIVPPRMGLYIQRNIQIQKIFQRYAPQSDIYPYSIDEGFIDLTRSLNYFVPNSEYTRRKKLDVLSRRIQEDIKAETRLVATIGMSNANPLLAKLALDNEAKKTKDMRTNWSYEEVESKVWKIESLTDFWGIGSRMARRLGQMGILTVYDLAHANPEQLKDELGVIGVQLYFHANGVDESKVSKPYFAKSRGLGNSQVLPRDYHNQREIELVLSEMAEQVAIRLRRHHQKTTNVAIHVSYSRGVDKKSISVQKKIEPTQSSKQLIGYVLELFRRHYYGGAVRNIAVRYGGLVEETYQIFSLFEDNERLFKEEQLDETVDQIRARFGHISVIRASALLEGSRTIARSNFIGGHSAGGLDGLI